MHGLGVRGFVEVLFKHRFTILLVFAATAITVAAGTFLMSPTYEADSQLLVKYGREYAYRPEIGNSNNSGYRPDLSGIMKAEIQILTSRDIASKTISSLGVQKLFPTADNVVTDDVIQNFMGSLVVNGYEDSGVIELSFQHHDPQLAAKTLNVLVDLFKSKHLDTFTDPEASGFLQKKTDEFRHQLAESQDKLRQLKLEHGTYSLDEQRSLLLKQRSDLDAQLKSAEDSVAEANERLGSLKGQEGHILEIARNYTDTDRYKLVDDTRAKLLDLQLQEQQKKEKYVDNSPFLTEVQGEIGTVSSFLDKSEQSAREQSALSSPVYQELSQEMMKTTAELKSQQGRIGVLQGQLAILNQQLKEITEPENQYRDLERQVASNETNYKDISAKLVDAQLSEDMNRLKMTNVRIIQAAAVPQIPVKPRKMLNILIGCFLGLSAGIGLAIGSELLSGRISLPSQAEYRLGIPVLAVLPYNPRYLARV